MPNIFLSPSNQTDNAYACGHTTEGEAMGKVAEKLKPILERCGFKTMLMHHEDMATKVAAANKWGADLYVPIHSNASGCGVSGTRMFYGAEAGREACECIAKYLFPLSPGDSENIQHHPSFYEISAPSAITAYIEVDFHDVASVAEWLHTHPQEIAEAIAKGICDYYSMAYVPEKATTVPQEQPKGGKLYRVQVGAYRKKENAQKQQEALKKAGFEGFIVEVIV